MQTERLEYRNCGDVGERTTESEANNCRTNYGNESKTTNEGNEASIECDRSGFSDSKELLLSEPSDGVSNRQQFVVTGILSQHKVQSFLALKLCPSSTKYRELLAKHLKNEDEIDSSKTIYAIESHPTNPTQSEIVGSTELLDHDDVETESHESEGQSIHSVRKKLRARRKEAIQRHLDSKHDENNQDSTSLGSNVEASHQSKLEQEQLYVIDVVKHLLLLEDVLLRMQSKFNSELLELASDKIYLRDYVHAQIERVKEINDILGNGDELIENIMQIEFISGEYTDQQGSGLPPSKYASMHMLDEQKLRDYFRGTIFDTAFLLCNDAGLSPEDEKANAHTRLVLERERAQLINEMKDRSKSFDESLTELVNKQAAIAFKLKLGEAQLALLAKQIEILSDFDAQENSLKSTLVDGIEYEKALKELHGCRQGKLNSLKVSVALSFSDINLPEKQGDGDGPVLFSHHELKNLKDTYVKLENDIKDHKANIQGMRTEKRSLSTSISKLKTELKQHQHKCNEIKIQKFGKVVDASVLDISPVPEYDDESDVMKMQNKIESCYQRDLEQVHKEQHMLKDKLLCVTNENTQLLRNISSLREQHMQLNEDIQNMSSSGKNGGAKKDHSDASEHMKFLALASQQKQEIERLQLEIQSLKSKKGHVNMNFRLPRM